MIIIIMFLCSVFLPNNSAVSNVAVLISINSAVKYNAALCRGAFVVLCIVGANTVVSITFYHR